VTRTARINDKEIKSFIVGVSNSVTCTQKGFSSSSKCADHQFVIVKRTDEVSTKKRSRQLNNQFYSCSDVLDTPMTFSSVLCTKTYQSHLDRTAGQTPAVGKTKNRGDSHNDAHSQATALADHDHPGLH
jgi:hypothetical protein